MRLILSLLLILSFTACSSKQYSPEATPVPETSSPAQVGEANVEATAKVEAPAQVEAPKEVTVPEVKKIKIFLETSNFSVKQVARLEKIRAEVEKIVNSEKFKEHVTGYYIKGSRKFNETKLSNDKVFETLTAKDWQVKIEYERGSRGVLGWTNPSTPWIWFNSRYFDGRDDDGLAGTFCHEMAHKFGFGHAYRDYNGREFTVPYGVGTICSQLYSKVL